MLLTLHFQNNTRRCAHQNGHIVILPVSEALWRQIRNNYFNYFSKKITARL